MGESIKRLFSSRWFLAAGILLLLGNFLWNSFASTPKSNAITLTQTQLEQYLSQTTGEVTLQGEGIRLAIPKEALNAVVLAGTETFSIQMEKTAQNRFFIGFTQDGKKLPSLEGHKFTVTVTYDIPKGEPVDALVCTDEQGNAVSVLQYEGNNYSFVLQNTGSYTLQTTTAKQTNPFPTWVVILFVVIFLDAFSMRIVRKNTKRMREIDSRSKRSMRRNQD